MRKTPRLLAAATVFRLPVACFSRPFVAGLLVHGDPASVFIPAPGESFPTWSDPCASSPSTASTPTA
jgi:hypothetical protein